MSYMKYYEIAVELQLWIEVVMLRISREGDRNAIYRLI